MKRIATTVCALLLCTACDSGEDNGPAAADDAAEGKNDNSDVDGSRNLDLCEGMTGLFGTATTEETAVEVRGTIAGDCAGAGEAAEPQLSSRAWYSCEKIGNTSTAQIHSKMYHGGDFLAFETVTLTQSQDGSLGMQSFTGLGGGDEVAVREVQGEAVLDEFGLELGGVVGGTCLGLDGSVGECQLEFSSTVWREADGRLKYEGDTKVAAGPDAGTHVVMEMSSDAAEYPRPSCG